jgi:hypothetical protein
MATSWFKFNCPGVAPDPCCNPLNYVLTIPAFVTGGPIVNYIFATTQIIAGVIRPIITAALCIEIKTAKATLTSTPNVYVGPNCP